MTARSGAALRMAYLVAGVAGVGFFVLSVVLLGAWPARVLADEAARMSPPNPLGLTDEAQTAGAILGYNFQSTVWYDDAYRLLTKQGLELKPKGDNWLARVYRQVIKGEWL